MNFTVTSGVHRTRQNGQLQPSAATRKFRARVSKILPQFDACSRTLKVRLEADNDDYALRPDMFVDVECPVTLPPAITVPIDALLDSGLRKTVFVDRGNGLFEPRQVETGWRFGDRVEIVKGLKPGERIVVSGNFLLDSESRMRTEVPKAAAAGQTASPSPEPSGKAGRRDTGMINRIVDFSVNNKFIVLALVAAACLAGWLSMKHVALDAIPDYERYPGHHLLPLGPSPDIMEDQVTYPIVTAMLGAPNGQGGPGLLRLRLFLRLRDL